MSMEGKIRRNWEHSEIPGRSRLDPVTEKQKSLTQEWILPYQEAILEDISSIRREVDKELQQSIEVRRAMRFGIKSTRKGCVELL